tara:strand:- start:2 stop:169 length:168 start_codon:yes stop_codon:yes gene_type:complete
MKSRAADNAALRERNRAKGFVYYRPKVTQQEKEMLTGYLEKLRTNKIKGSYEHSI